MLIEHTMVAAVTGQRTRAEERKRGRKRGRKRERDCYTFMVNSKLVCVCVCVCFGTRIRCTTFFALISFLFLLVWSLRRPPAIIIVPNQLARRARCEGEKERVKTRLCDVQLKRTANEWRLCTKKVHGRSRPADNNSKRRAAKWFFVFVFCFL